jgi:hypothetical protein
VLVAVFFLAACGSSGAGPNSLTDMPPTAVAIAVQSEGATNTLKLSGIEPGASWEYSLDEQRSWSAGKGAALVLVYGHMGPGDLARNVLTTLPKSKLGAGAMTLWFQQTGSLPTHYAIEVILAAAD